jgi:predicted phosphodiesterase
VISDLHLGKRGDLLRRPDLRAPLLEALDGIDRLVLLGDAVELRDQPQRAGLDVAGDFFADVGRALGPDGELLVVAGNHDHGLVAGWIEGRLQSEPSGFLTLEHRIEPAAAGPLAEALAERAAPARTAFAYPGAWLRDDVYAIHGHYADLHSTVPTIERLAAGAMARWAVDLPQEGAVPDDYEAALAPIYAWMHALTQRHDRATVSAGASASARVWVALAGEGRKRHPLRTLALGAGFSTAVAGLNAVGLGPLDRRLTGGALRRGYLHGIREVLRRLDVRAPYVLWGHSHRAGPWPADDPAEWLTHAGGAILNTGSWVYQPHFLGERPSESPYRPGVAALLEDGEPPRLLRLLGDRGHEELRTPAPA